MKRTSKKDIPATTIDVVELTCDKCGRHIGRPRADENVAEVEIRKRTGTYWPEGFFYDDVVIDCCVDCFEQHVIPALEAVGFKPRREEVDG